MEGSTGRIKIRERLQAYFVSLAVWLPGLIVVWLIFDWLGWPTGLLVPIVIGSACADAERRLREAS